MNKTVDAALDLVWDLLEPLAGRCPVCAFARGLLAGLLLELLVVAAVLIVVQ